MDYAEALEYISATGRFGIKLGLDRTRALLEALGSPDRGLRGVLVAGTNGKGSTCAMITSGLVAGGLRVGSMPKPHLQSYTERICVDGVPISEADFAELVTEVRPSVEAVGRELGAPTEFEMLTAAALLHLRRRQVDLLVCEVGLGGRLDSTNVLDPGVKVITNIALDHQQYLGPDVGSIATEKAGIIRAGDAVVTGELPDEAADVVEARCAAAPAASLWRVGREVLCEPGQTDGDTTAQVTVPGRPPVLARVPLAGLHQAHNLAVAVAALEAMINTHDLAIDREAALRGVAQTRWPARLERVGPADRTPEWLLDAGHNPAAVEAAVAGARQLLPAHGHPVVVLFAAMQDKDWAGMLGLLPREWPAVHTAVSEERAQEPTGLLATAREIGRAGDEAVTGVEAAMRRARELAGPTGTVLVVGSLYLAGAVRQELGLGWPAPG